VFTIVLARLATRIAALTPIAGHAETTIVGIPFGAYRQDVVGRRPIRSRLAAGVWAAGLVVIGISGSVHAQTATQTGGSNQAIVPLPSFSPLVERVMPAVVNISVVLNEQQVAQSEEDGGGGVPGAPGGMPSPFDEFLRRFFDQQGLPRTPETRPRPRAGRAVALGSGFIIDPKGYVVTNNHVVGNAEKVTVIFQDNSKYPARIVGRDDKTDVALVKIDAKKALPSLTWGDSNSAKVGDWVVAVGNPFGLGGTVTAGIISALGRNIEAGPYDDFLQIDAAINRGNSGGPTFDTNGQVIGINTAIYSPSGGSVGIGFAVPSNLAKNIVAQLEQGHKVTRGWLGVQIQKITPEIAKGLGLDPDNPKGALVASVNDNSPAAEAGIKPGDVIVRFNGKEVRDVHDLPRLVAETPIGQKAEITVLRNGKEQTVQAKIAELKEKAEADTSGGGEEQQGQPQHSSVLGLALSPLDDATRKRAGVPAGVGVMVVDVAPDSPAAGLVEPNDVILSINQQPVSDPADAAQKLKEASAKKQVLLLVNHRGTALFVGLPLEETPG
jgi:serine protease Do